MRVKLSVLRATVGAALVVIAADIAVFAQSARPPDRPGAGPPQQVSPGAGGRRWTDLPVIVDTNEIRAATPAELSRPVADIPPQDGLTPAQRAARRRAALARDAGRRVSTTVGVEPRPLKPEYPDVDEWGERTPLRSATFEGLDQVTAGGLRPSDMALAVGPVFVFQAVNSAATVLGKTGVVEVGWPKTLAAFFKRPAGTFVFDPRALYDWRRGRYVCVAVEADFANSRGFILLAASKTDDPRGSWAVYRVQMGRDGECPDFPTLGSDPLGIYVSANRFGCGPDGFTGPFNGSEVWLIPKSKVYAGTALTFWAQSGFSVGGVLVDTIQPANVQGMSDFPRAEFMVNSFNLNFGGGQCFGGCSGLVVWAVSNQFGFLTAGAPTPEFTGVIVPTQTYYLPDSANQPSGLHTISTVDTRITGSVTYQSGSLWAAVTTWVPRTEQQSVLWWEIAPVLNDNNDVKCTGAYQNACPQIIGAERENQNCFFCGAWAANGCAYFPTIQPDLERNWTMVFAWSSSTTRPGVAYTSRRVTNLPDAAHDAGFILIAGQADWKGFRWGDYSGTSVDLTSPVQPFLWFSGMYTRRDGTWGTRIGKNAYTAPAQP